MSSSQTFEWRVYFEDTDAGGVVYNANYLKFYERARTEFLRTLGFEQDDLLAQNIVFVVRNINIDFVKAARFNEILIVESNIVNLKKASLVFKQEIFTENNGQKVLVNNALVKVVCVNADSFIPTGIPADIIDKLNQ
ncbi:MAG: tol-pal system-associated acyl-CoA thioesterase [Gammaproteobacteria bacterium]|jgi:acyl-CoA thioester hydrolase|nr:tol-pal system-associated acyl-CoA thioesterase [Gammaproteobacteria bacterium]MBT6553284.1 tol-pal system-associated acyl-CoA thioesterase [Gammaproteobacteria bacterium]MBT7045089.1 tol-pal system-associated acyl-CoA thioesterase [Gammaproteobacteria bacterium]